MARRKGRSVLDIGAYDGYFSFAAERAGAARVVALDHYVWFTDMAGYMADWRASVAVGGTPLPAPHESRHWKPQEMPGRRPFDMARKALDSRVVPVVGDFMTMDLSKLGTFDVVLFLGVLYHLQDPLGALRRLASVVAPGGRAYIDTQGMELNGPGEDPAYWACYPGQELNNDASNWWVPNAAALLGCCRATGFREVALVIGPPDRGRGGSLRLAGEHFLHALGLRRAPNRSKLCRLVVRASR
jgi:tRNA (mo5U34)-methyltransferase